MSEAPSLGGSSMSMAFAPLGSGGEWDAPLAGGAGLGSGGLSIAAVPEPAAGLLAVGGLVVLACSAMRCRRAAREGRRAAAVAVVDAGTN